MRCSPADINDVTRILSDDSVFSYIVDDATKDVSSMREYAQQLLDNVRIYVLKPRVNSIFIFIPSNHVTFDVHSAVIKGGGRRFAVKDAQKCVLWMLERTRAMKFTTLAPKCNRRAAIFASMCGMVKEGCITKSFMKNDALYDIDIYGADKDLILDKIGG